MARFPSSATPRLLTFVEDPLADLSALARPAAVVAFDP
jgi:hypothetical protein